MAGKRGRRVGVILQKTDKGAFIRDDKGDNWRVIYGMLTKEPAQ
jgi:hypothetical protein